MKQVFADGRVIGKISIEINFNEETLDMSLKTKADVSEVPSALKALGFDGESGLDKAKAIVHEVAIGTPIEGALGLERSKVEKGVKSANPNNPSEIKEAVEGKQVRPAAEVQKEVLQQTPQQEEEIVEFQQDAQDFEEEQQKKMQGGF